MTDLRWVETPRGSRNWVYHLDPCMTLVVYEEERATSTLAAKTAWTFKIIVRDIMNGRPFATATTAQRAALRAAHKFAVGLAATTVAAVGADGG
jgi:hypothetical protein